MHRLPTSNVKISISSLDSWLLKERLVEKAVKVLISLIKLPF